MSPQSLFLRQSTLPFVVELSTFRIERLSFGFLMRCLWKVPLNLKQCWHSYRHISFEKTYSVTFTLKIYLISDISIDSLSEVWLLKYFLAGTSDVRSRISLKKQRSNSSPLIHSIAISLNWSLIIYSQWTEISSPWWNLMHLILFNIWRLKWCGPPHSCASGTPWKYGMLQIMRRRREKQRAMKIEELNWNNI